MAGEPRPYPFTDEDSSSPSRHLGIACGQALRNRVANLAQGRGKLTADDREMPTHETDLLETSGALRVGEP